MRRGIKGFVLSLALCSTSVVPGFAQGGDPVSGFNNILIGVSVLLIAVSFMFVMMKVAKFVDVLTARLEKDASDSSE